MYIIVHNEVVQINLRKGVKWKIIKIIGPVMIIPEEG